MRFFAPLVSRLKMGVKSQGRKSEDFEKSSENPKFEIRNSKQYQNSNFQMIKTVAAEIAEAAEEQRSRGAERQRGE